MITTQSTATADLITDARRLITSIEPLFYTLIKGSERFNLPTIEISTARAREIVADLLVIKKKLKSLASDTAAATMTTDRHLDAIFNLNQ